MIRETLSLVGSLVLIVLVLALTYYATRWYARRMGQQTGSGKYIKVLDRSALGTGASAVIVMVAGKYYLLGVGDKNVNFLCELPEFEETPQTAPVQAAPFSEALRQAFDKMRGVSGGKDGEDRP